MFIRFGKDKYYIFSTFPHAEVVMTKLITKEFSESLISERFTDSYLIRQ